MPDFDNVIQLCEPETVPEGVFGIIKALPNRLAVLMHEGKSQNGVLMPLSGRCSPDVGIVVSSGVGIGEGTEVLVHPYHGAWYDNYFGTGKQMRLYGVTADWHDSVVAIRQNGFIMPTMDWVLIARNVLSASEGGIALLEGYSSERGEVVAIGPAVKEVRAEQSVLFHVKQWDDTKTFKFGTEDMRSWILIKEADLLARIEE